MNHDTAIACVARLLLPACNLCGGQDHRPVFHKLERLVRCVDCDLIFVHDLPGNSAVEGRHAAMAQLGGTLPIPGSRRFRNAGATATRHLEVLSRSAPSAAGRKLLDIACSNGIFLDRARTAGFEVYGSDYSPDAARFAQDLFQLDVHCGDWRDAGYGDQAFDVVTLFNVLEHLPDPLTELATIRRLLSPGGIMVLSASDIAGLVPRVFEGLMRRRHSPGTFYRFTPYTLTEMAALAGYEPLRIDQPRVGIGNRFYLTVRNSAAGGLVR